MPVGRVSSFRNNLPIATNENVWLQIELIRRAFALSQYQLRFSAEVDS